MRAWVSRQDDRAGLAGVARALDGDLHRGELMGVRCTPHRHIRRPRAAGRERARRDQVRMARPVARPRIPALVELTRAERRKVLHGELNLPAARGVLRDRLPGRCRARPHRRRLGVERDYGSATAGAAACQAERRPPPRPPRRPHRGRRLARRRESSSASATTWTSSPEQARPLGFAPHGCCAVAGRCRSCQGGSAGAWRWPGRPACLAVLRRAERWRDFGLEAGRWLDRRCR